MADDFDEFGRGDLIYKGGSLGEAISGRAHLENGSSIVKTLRRGVAGSHKGSLVGTVSFSQAVLKAGMREDFVDLILKQRKATITAVLSDDVRIQVKGIMQGGDFAFCENSMVTGDFAITGKVTRV